jgi:hypothetical protein
VLLEMLPEEPRAQNGVVAARAHNSVTTVRCHSDTATAACHDTRGGGRRERRRERRREQDAGMGSGIRQEKRRRGTHRRHVARGDGVEQIEGTRQRSGWERRGHDRGGEESTGEGKGTGNGTPTAAMLPHTHATYKFCGPSTSAGGAPCRPSAPSIVPRLAPSRRSTTLEFTVTNWPCASRQLGRGLQSCSASSSARLRASSSAASLATTAALFSRLFRPGVSETPSSASSWQHADGNHGEYIRRSL